MGMTSGRWEGDTLVLDSIGFIDTTWIGRGGYFQSDKMHIVSGRLRSRRAGTQHFIEESDLLTLVPPAESRLPAAWRRTATGEPMPDVVRAVRRSREGR